MAATDTKSEFELRALLNNVEIPGSNISETTFIDTNHGILLHNSFQTLINPTGIICLQAASEASGQQITTGINILPIPPSLTMTIRRIQYPDLR